MGRSLLDIFRAARPIKIVPLWMLVGAGALIAPSPVHGATLAIALAGIVGASLAAMHINVVTDAELDAGTKPQLWAWMAANEPAAKRVVGGEFVVAGLSVLWLATKCDFAVAGFVVLYTAMGCLYSFNFLCPARPVQTRLKVSWWGHMVSMTAIYVSSWMAGLFSCEAFGWRVLARWGFCSCSPRPLTTRSSSRRVRLTPLRNALPASIHLRRSSGAGAASAWRWSWRRWHAQGSYFSRSPPRCELR